MKNNLFSYATSELSQDAFICWLCSFALPDARHNPALRNCAHAMLEVFVPGFRGKDVELLEIAKQTDDIDVLFTARCEGTEYKIIFEDKVYSSEHDDQLNRYWDKLKEKTPDCQVRGVYYKTGFESNLDNVKDKGYHVVGREDVLAVLKDYVDKSSSDILRDYYEYWERRQQKAESYQTLPVNEWGWWQAYALFDALHQNMPEGIGSSYGYVANPSGGFDCLVFWASDDLVMVKNTPCELYMHLEFHSNEASKKSQVIVTLKLGIKKSKGELKSEGLSFSRLRDEFIFDNAWNYTLGKYNFNRPARLGSGEHITLGIYNGDCSTAEKCRETLHRAVEDYRRLLGDMQWPSIPGMIQVCSL